MDEQIQPRGARWDKWFMRVILGCVLSFNALGLDHEYTRSRSFEEAVTQQFATLRTDETADDSAVERIEARLNRIEREVSAETGRSEEPHADWELDHFCICTAPPDRRLLCTPPAGNCGESGKRWCNLSHLDHACCSLSEMKDPFNPCSSIRKTIKGEALEPEHANR
jgi:hypothetical protein